MTSANFLLCYASVTNTLFDQFEQDLQLVATAFLDDDEDVPVRVDVGNTLAEATAEAGPLQ